MRADVDDLSRGAAQQPGRNRRAHHVVDEREAAGLAPVTDHGERLPTQELPQEDRDHASDVQAVEPRPIDVEVAEDRDGQAEPAVRQAEVLGGRLGRRVAPAVDAGRAEHPVGVLRPGHRGVAAVDLGGRAEDHAPTVLVRGAQDVLGAVHIHVQHVVRVRDVVLDADHPGEVVDHVGLRCHPIDDLRVHDRVDDEVKARVPQQGADLRLRARVEDDHLVAPRDEGIGEV